MNTPPFITLLISFLSLLGLTMATSSPFVGKWNLVEVYDENDEIVTIPDGSFVMTIIQPDKEKDKALKFNWKIGNILRASIEVQDDDGADGDDNSIKIGPIMSTMMMPPEPIWKLESFAKNALEKVDSMEKEESGSLEMKGTGGRFKFEQSS